MTAPFYTSYTVIVYQTPTTMASTVIFPLNEVERRHVFDIIHFSQDKIWRYVGSLLADKFDVDAGDQDAIRETIVHKGQFLYQYVLLKLMDAFPGKFEHLQSGPLLYRFIWLEITRRHANVLHKGTLWHSSPASALTDGLKYISSYDCIASADDSAHVLLSVESLCQCQVLKCPFLDDIYCIDNCHCTNTNWYSYSRPCALPAGTGCHSQICVVDQTTKVLVIRLSLELKTCHGDLHAFCIPRTDTYFYSRHKTISRAFRDFITL